MLCTLRYYAQPAISSQKVVAMLTAPINRLQNVLSLNSVAILVSSCSTCPKWICLELLWSLSIELMARLLMLDVNRQIIHIQASSWLYLPSLISTVVGSHESAVIRITGKCIVSHSVGTRDSKCTTLHCGIERDEDFFRVDAKLICIEVVVVDWKAISTDLIRINQRIFQCCYKP